jgi:hypothetical protein
MDRFFTPEMTKLFVFVDVKSKLCARNLKFSEMFSGHFGISAKRLCSGVATSLTNVGDWLGPVFRPCKFSATQIKA